MCSGGICLLKKYFITKLIKGGINFKGIQPIKNNVLKVHVHVKYHNIKGIRLDGNKLLTALT